MAVFTAQKTMLYCPKCRSTYQEGTQRFCSHDGIRLVPASSQGKTGAYPKGVFSNILNKTVSNQEKKKINREAPPSSKVEEIQPEPIFQPPSDSKFFRSENAPSNEETKSLRETKKAETKKQEQPAKPLPRLIRPSEINVSQAKLGDRSVNPAGRVALTWENTEILLGKTVKGRYQITEKLSEDELSVAYLAEDKIVAGRKAVVRVLMVEKDADDYLNKIFAEERVSLSHINHPNVAHLFDSGELPEGKIFIVTEFVEGVSLLEKLRHTGTFNPLRAARIIRQAANALNEAHVSGILHRNLKPQNIILSISESGVEQVKVTDFAVYDGFEEQTQENIRYLSPEQLEGKMPSFASDIFSLAVIAYQMLTGRVPFNYSTEKDLLKAQKEGLSLRPTNLRLDLSAQVDEVLEKALAFKPEDRFPKARDFGDAFYNSLTVNAPWDKSATETGPKEDKTSVVKEEKPPIVGNEKFQAVSVETAESGKTLAKSEPEVTRAEAAETEDLKVPQAENLENPLVEAGEEKTTVKTPEKLSQKKTERTEEKAEREEKKSSSRMMVFALGLVVLGIGVWAIWSFLSFRQARQNGIPQNNAEIAGPTNAALNQNTTAPAAENPILKQVEPTPSVVESPPAPRRIIPPPNSVYFQNTRENLKGELAKNFRAFSLYYPNDWKKGTSETNFVDVARIGATGTPIEQMLVSYYESKGTLTADQGRFQKLVEQSNKFFSEQFPNYRLVSEGATRINGGWKAYEMKFQGAGVTRNGDKIAIWGRRLWIPAGRDGEKIGFVVTMLATSLSPEVKSADDVGVRGELAGILETFEPAALNAAN